MNDQLSNELADIADEMPDTDLGSLRSRVGKRSRYLRVRRTVVQSAAAAVAVVGLAGGVVLMAQSNQPDTRNDDPASSASASAAVSPSPSPPAEPVAGLGSASASRAPGIPGTLSFLDVRPGSPIKLTRVVDGVPTTGKTFGTAKEGDQYIAEPAPDGSAVAVLVSPDRGSVAPGKLQIIKANGQRQTLADEVGWGGGRWPAWTPDSKAVIIGKTRYDAVSGAQSTVADLETSDGYLVWSPSGTRRANADFGSGETVAVARADGSDRRTFSLSALSGPAGAPTSVQAVSDDGRYLALGDANSDPSHVSTTSLVYDTQAQKAVTLPASIGSVRHVYFRAGGDMLVNTDKGYTIVAMNGTKGATYPTLTGVTGNLMAYKG